MQVDPYNKIVIAYSGGLDSEVLLHQLANSNARGKLIAVHVNHGLSPNADSWQQHCAKRCQQLNVDFQVESIVIDKQSGASLEAQARELRYQALAKYIEPGTALFTAHHQDDQVETVFLQLLRGAGPRGLAAMPEKKPFAKGVLCRPLLHCSKQQLQEYATKYNLTWCEDESNSVNDFDRNYLRLQILPLLKQRWPQMQTTISRSANLCADASELLEDLAAIDHQSIATTDNGLNCSLLQELSYPRMANVIRFWLRKLGFQIPDQKHLQRIINEIIPAREDATPLVAWQDVEVRRFKNILYAIAPHNSWDLTQQFTWNLPNNLKIPGVGELSLVATTNDGFKLPDNKNLTVKFRQGGERFTPHNAIGSRPLKKLLQEWQVPPWQRERIPLIYSEDKLIAVADLAIAKDSKNKSSETSYKIMFQNAIPK